MNIIKNFEDLKLLKSIPLDTVFEFDGEEWKNIPYPFMQTAIWSAIAASHIASNGTASCVIIPTTRAILESIFAKMEYSNERA